jgi:HAD superfamily phosphoserine phosphatase-like hydrolase
MEANLTDQLLGAFAVSSRERAEVKLRKLQDRASGVHMVFDFDRTLTCARTSGEDFYSWTIMASFLPKSFEQEAAELYRAYRPLELRGELTHELAAEWWNWSLGMMRRGGVNLLEVERDFLKVASIRPGVKELFDLCERRSIPTVILSAGVTNIIEMWCKHYGIRPAVVISTRLELTPEGRIAGWDPDNLVHVLNKRERGHGELSRLRAERPNIVLVGDSLDDAGMAEGDEDVLRVRIYDPRADERDNEAARRATLERFDLMIGGKSLEPLVGVLEAAVTV